MGKSMLATMVSSVTFVANFGASYAKDWSLLVPGFLLIAVLPIVGRFIIPFDRQEIRMSAYEYFVLYLMALTLSSVTGWDSASLIIGVAGVMPCAAASKPSSRPTSSDLNSVAVVAVEDFCCRVRPLAEDKDKGGASLRVFSQCVRK